MDAARRDPILIVTGPPGAGKTTTARIVATGSEPAVHLESDHFFRFIQAGYVEPWKPESHAQNQTVMRIVAQAAAAYADAGYFTVVDGIVTPRWFYEPLRDQLRDAGHTVAYAVLRPSLAVCRARAAGRDPRQIADAAVFERLWREFDDLGPLEAHVVDTSAASPAEAADLLLRRLREGSL
jgi:predicted kinase